MFINRATNVNLDFFYNIMSEYSINSKPEGKLILAKNDKHFVNR